MSYSNFTSLPPEQEQQFVVFERQSVESSKKAMMVGLISGAVLGLFLIVVYAASDPPAAMHADALDNDMTEEKSPVKRKKKAPAPAPTETAPAAGSEGAAAPAAGAEGAAAAAPEGAAAEGAAAEGAAEAPAAPKGATKAPPSALVGQ